MASLYEIDKAIVECVDMETGEIIDSERLSQLQMEWGVKIESVALWYKNLLSDAEAFKREKDTFAQREKSARNKAESLKQYLGDSLNGTKFETNRVRISYRKSDSVEIEDMNSIDEDYLNHEEPSVDKTKIKSALKAGIDIPGAKLVTRQNLQIK